LQDRADRKDLGTVGGDECCRVLQSVAECCSVMLHVVVRVAMCCSVCCSVCCCTLAPWEAMSFQIADRSEHDSTLTLYWHRSKRAWFCLCVKMRSSLLLFHRRASVEVCTSTGMLRQRWSRCHPPHGHCEKPLSFLPMPVDCSGQPSPSQGNCR